LFWKLNKSKYARNKEDSVRLCCWYLELEPHAKLILGVWRRARFEMDLIFKNHHNNCCHCKQRKRVLISIYHIKYILDSNIHNGLNTFSMIKGWILLKPVPRGVNSTLNIPVPSMNSLNQCFRFWAFERDSVYFYLTNWNFSVRVIIIIVFFCENMFQINALILNVQVSIETYIISIIFFCTKNRYVQHCIVIKHMFYFLF
jgi:hypothetical protein